MYYYKHAIMGGGEEGWQGKTKHKAEITASSAWRSRERRTWRGGELFSSLTGSEM